MHRFDVDWQWRSFAPGCHFGDAHIHTHHRPCETQQFRAALSTPRTQSTLATTRAMTFEWKLRRQVTAVVCWPLWTASGDNRPHNFSGDQCGCRCDLSSEGDVAFWRSRSGGSPTCILRVSLTQFLLRFCLCLIACVCVNWSLCLFAVELGLVFVSVVLFYICIGLLLCMAYLLL